MAGDPFAQTPLERSLREEIGRVAAVGRQVDARLRLLYISLNITLFLLILASGVCAYALLRD
jgi:hypothetical protein